VRNWSLEETPAAVVLERAGLGGEATRGWLAQEPRPSEDWRRDAGTFAALWRQGDQLIAKLPPKPRRNAAETGAAAMIHERDRAARDRFLAAHAEPLYRALTRDYAVFHRVEALVYEAAALVPGLVPERARVAAESEFFQNDKEGSEIDQGLFLSQILAHPRAGAHLCHAMLLPRPESHELRRRYHESGRLDLGVASVERRGKASVVTLQNPRFLNAEDDATLDLTEAAVDVAILDGASGMAVLRGGPVAHPKWAGRRVFCSGINLTHLYQGKIPYLWYMRRDMGMVNKMMRGIAFPDASPDEVCGELVEKPWLAAVEAFAIGGGCQYLLAMDYVLAARDAYMTLPARKEGIIPGAANLRMWRFTGDRIAREAILYGRRLDCDSPAGRMICDEVVDPAAMDQAIDKVVLGFTDSGTVSAAGNRRAIRVGAEPLDLFRRYMAVYAREQAFCHFSPALISNLERHWNAQQRKV
jgi:(3,5-dihydroxyphenyl)acetyl-CoA 1,2-dioxygenase